MTQARRNHDRENRIREEIIVDAYESTGRAIEDWHYWIAQGNCF
jgi:hypothetical protein